MNHSLMIFLLLVSLIGYGHAQQAQPPANPNDPSQKVAHPPVATNMNSVVSEFPPEARAKRISGGLCLVSLTVDTAGIPQDIHLVRCTDPVFAKNSLKAAGQYRFTPATLLDGTPVEAKITVTAKFVLKDPQREDVLKGTIPVGCGFASPRNTTSSAADSSGVYPFTKLLAPPAFKMFNDEGYEDAAFSIVGNGVCDVVLTINEKGKPSDLREVHCETKSLEKPAAQSLLKSRYTPATLNGKAVPVKVSMHLELGDFPPIP